MGKPWPLPWGVAGSTIDADPDLERVTPWQSLELDESDNLLKFNPHENG